MKHFGFETVGDIAIFSSSLITRKDLKLRAKKILENKNIKTVLLRENVKGRLRKAKYIWLAGKKRTLTFHKESGCLMKVDLSKTYFSSRLGSERLFIANDLVKEIKKKKIKNPMIIVLFSGIAPYALVIAKILKKNKINANITSIELNKQASKLAKENVLLNKLNNVSIIQGDVKRLSLKFKHKFNFVVAPRPQLKYNFLKEILLYGKKDSVVYYRDFVSDGELKKLKSRIKKEANSLNFDVKIGWLRKAGQIKPRFWRVMVKMKR